MRECMVHDCEREGEWEGWAVYGWGKWATPPPLPLSCYTRRRERAAKLVLPSSDDTRLIRRKGKGE